MARKRVDWDAEIRKTENIRRKGLLMSGLSFGMACALIFSMSKYTGKDITIPRSVLVAVCFCVSCVVLRVIMKKRAKEREQEQQNHDA